MEEFRTENAKVVRIDSSRWSVSIRIKDSEGKEHHFIASADSGLTEGSGIYFATLEEYQEDTARLW